MELGATVELKIVVRFFELPTCGGVSGVFRSDTGSKIGLRRTLSPGS